MMNRSGGEEHLNVLEVAVQALAVLLPGQLVHLAGTSGRLRLGVVAVNLQVTQLGVRDQLTVVDEAEPMPVPRVMTAIRPSRLRP